VQLLLYIGVTTKNLVMIDFDKFFGFNEKESVETLLTPEQHEKVWRGSIDGTYKGPIKSMSIDCCGNVYAVLLKF
jgi:hypothetical protein